MKRFTLLTMALVAVLMLAAFPAAAQEETLPNTITVNGTGTASGAPDIANMEIGVEKANADVAIAFEEANSTIDAIINAMVEAGVAREDIRTANLNIFQERYPSGPMGPGGQNPEDMDSVYRVMNQVRVTIRDTAIIADVINAAVEAGANNIYGLNFGIDDRDALESQARADAMADAEARAREYAELIGAELGDVVTIQEGYGGVGPFDVMNMSAPAMGGGGAAIEPGQLSVSVQVRVTYSINR